MAKKVLVITADDVVDTGRVSYKFIIQSKAPSEAWLSLSDRFGLLKLRDKDDGDINIFAAVRGEVEPAGNGQTLGSVHV